MVVSVILPAGTDKDFTFEDSLKESFQIALDNHLKITFQGGARPGPWCVQGPDSLSPLFGGTNLGKAIDDCIDYYPKWLRGDNRNEL